MWSKRNVSILGISILSLTVLSQFQNCAPAGPPSSQAQSETHSDARLIEDFNKAQIQFVANEVQVHDEANSVALTGLCNRAHNGSQLKWTIWASQGSALLKGEGSCSGGQFVLNMDHLSQMVCGVEHQLVVEGDWGGSAFTHVLKRCQPLISEEVAADEGAPLNTNCAIEYVPTEDAVQPCSKVCYRQGLVVSQIFVEPQMCATLTAKLTGP